GCDRNRFPRLQELGLRRFLSGPIDPLVPDQEGWSLLAGDAVRRALLQPRRECPRRRLSRAREGRQNLVQLEGLRAVAWRLVGGGPVRLLLVKAGELVHETALVRAVAPRLLRRLVPLCCRFSAACRCRLLGGAPYHNRKDPDEARRLRNPRGSRMDRHRRRAL